MKNLDQLELFKAALAVAVADGKLTRSEMGILKGLAARVGIDRASFEAMLEKAQSRASLVDNIAAGAILLRSRDGGRSALELLVAEARIDGEISDEEREVLIRVASKFGLAGHEFQSIYQAGIARADRIRAARRRRRRSRS